MTREQMLINGTNPEIIGVMDLGDKDTEAAIIHLINTVKDIKENMHMMR